MNYLMNWPNRKVLIKKTNRTEFKTTYIIVKRNRKTRNEVDVLIALEMISFHNNKMISAILLQIGQF